MQQAFEIMLLPSIAQRGHSGQRRRLGLPTHGDLQLVARARDFALDGFARGQHDAEFGVAADALHGGPGHGHFAEELAFDGEFAAILLDDGAGDGVSVSEHHLVGGQGSPGEQQEKGEAKGRSIGHGQSIPALQRPSSESRWHFLYFFPLPHQQGSLRPSFGSARWTVSSSTTSKPSRQTSYMDGSSASVISCRASSISARRFFNSLRASRESCAPYRASIVVAGSACAPCMTSALVSMLTMTRSCSSFSNPSRLSARLSRTSERPGTSGIRQSCWASAARSSASAPMESRRTMSTVSAGRWRAIRVKAQRAAPPMVSSSSGTNLARAESAAGSPISPSRASARTTSPSLSGSRSSP